MALHLPALPPPASYLPPSPQRLLPPRPHRTDHLSTSSAHTGLAGFIYGLVPLHRMAGPCSVCSRKPFVATPRGEVSSTSPCSGWTDESPSPVHRHTRYLLGTSARRPLQDPDQPPASHASLAPFRSRGSGQSSLLAVCHANSNSPPAAQARPHASSSLGRRLPWTVPQCTRTHTRHIHTHLCFCLVHS